MPKAAVDKDHLAARAKDEIRLSRQILRMKAIAITQAVDKTSRNHFWARVSASNSAHSFATFGWGERVHEIAKASDDAWT